MTRSLRWTAAAALASLLLPAPAPAQTAQSQPLAAHPRVAQAVALLETWLDAQRDYERIPGISAAVVHDQETVWAGGFGYADVARLAAATPATMYSICSISKLFTGIAVMRLREEGRLRLDDPVREHLPWFAIEQTADGSPEITIEGLLTHSAGLPRESDHAYWTGPDFDFPTRDEIIERLSGQQTLYPAETYFQYSNLGLSLAGEVVTAVAGRPYDVFVGTTILEPLGLSSTTTEMPVAERHRRLATGYSAIGRDGNRRPVPFFTANGIAPAAGFASTAEDLARFASWQFRLLAAGGREVLHANSLRKMHRVHWVDPDFSTTWGLGFSVTRRDDHTFIGHGGSCPGYRTQLLLEPADRIAAVFMANAQGVNANAYAQRIYDILAPAIEQALADSTGSIKASDALAAYAGSYATGFAGEIAVLPWEDGLATVGLPTMEPVSRLGRLRPDGEHAFRRVRRDGALGEPVVFEMGPDGRATRMIWHSNHYRRVR